MLIKTMGIRAKYYGKFSTWHLVKGTVSCCAQERMLQSIETRHHAEAWVILALEGGGERIGLVTGGRSSHPRTSCRWSHLPRPSVQEQPAILLPSQKRAAMAPNAPVWPLKGASHETVDLRRFRACRSVCQHQFCGLDGRPGLSGPGKAATECRKHAYQGF